MKRRDLVSAAIAAVAFLSWFVPMYLELPERYPTFDSLWLPKLVGFVMLSALMGAVSWVAGVMAKEGLRGKVTYVLTLAACNVFAVLMWTEYLNGALDPGKVRRRDGFVVEIQNPPRRAPRRRVEVHDGERTLETPFHADRFFWSIQNVRSGGPVVVRVGDGLFGATYVESISDPPAQP
ncbi:MAG: hypothetical protein IPM79_10220 [Polyangiaceae bacterium]|jgi:hypothetical protein|nr:hypothetical protein [Polyangiaceae bacterium]MBK8937998.1 hypothetical protein [Polyangiaceae bacterium]